MNKKQLEEYTQDIKNAYESSVTIQEAEKLAAKFLGAQLLIGEALRLVDLDSRMKKSGVKAIRAAVYLDTATKGDKKPSDVLIEAVINTDKVVQDQQELLDRAEVERDALQNYLSVFREAHIFFRGVAKAKFE